MVVSVVDPNSVLPPQGSLCLTTEHHGSINPGPSRHDLDQIGRATLASEFLLGST